MLHNVRRLAVIGAALLLLAPPPAHGTGFGYGKVWMVGEGTIYPGLTTVSQPQWFSFDTIAAFGGGWAVDDDPSLGIAVGQVRCVAQGGGIGSIATGSGTLDAECQTMPVSVGWGQVVCYDLPYTMAGTQVFVFGINTCAARAALVGVADVTPPTTATWGVFEFIPTSANPVTAYRLVGEAEFAGGDSTL